LKSSPPGCVLFDVVILMFFCFAKSLPADTARWSYYPCPSYKHVNQHNVLWCWYCAMFQPFKSFIAKPPVSIPYWAPMAAYRLVTTAALRQVLRSLPLRWSEKHHVQTCSNRRQIVTLSSLRHWYDLVWSLAQAMKPETCWARACHSCKSAALNVSTVTTWHNCDNCEIINNYDTLAIHGWEQQIPRQVEPRCKGRECDEKSWRDSTALCLGRWSIFSERAAEHQKFWSLRVSILKLHQVWSWESSWSWSGIDSLLSGLSLPN